MKLGLLLEFHVVLIVGLAQPSLLDRCQDGAAWLVGVRAVAKSTLGSQIVDAGEAVGDPLGGCQEAEFTHPRRVDQHGTLIQGEELAACGRVPALARGAHGVGFQRVSSEEMVEQRRLADARRAEETVGLSRLDDLSDLVDPGTGNIADWEHLERDVSLLDARNRLVQGLAVDQVGFGEKKDRLDSPLVHHHQVPFKSPYVEVEVARLDDEGGIDVRRNDLIVDFVAGRFSTEERFAWHDAPDNGVGTRVVILDGDPIAHTGQIEGRVGRVKELPCDLGMLFAVFVSYEVSAPVYCRHPSQVVPRRGHLVSLRAKPVVQTNFCQVHSVPSPGLSRHAGFRTRGGFCEGVLAGQLARHNSRWQGSLEGGERVNFRDDVQFVEHLGRAFEPRAIAFRIDSLTIDGNAKRSGEEDQRDAALNGHRLRHPI